MAELDSQPKSIQSLYSWYSQNKLWVNRRYQRKLVWTLPEKQKLIESVTNRYPIPAILLVERENGFEVIDGLQRLHSIMSFIEMGFPTTNEAFFDVDQLVTAKNRSASGAFDILTDVKKLEISQVSSILDYSMAVTIMRDASEKEVDDVFSRINTYGHQLSDQERRQAGVQGNFPNLVRELSCKLRGDVSSDLLELADMPSISIDMPTVRHGYDLAAQNIFWVEQGVLRSTDLRDSMDEQCVADIAASIIDGLLIPRSKDALDAVYQAESTEWRRISAALDRYGDQKFASEFNFIIEEIRKIVRDSDKNTLKLMFFSRRNTNPYPALFTVFFIALHELLVAGKSKISDYKNVAGALTGLDRSVNTSRGSTSPQDRRRNINIIKGLINSHLVPVETLDIYGEHTYLDVDEIIRRSLVESPYFELKQGILRLSDRRQVDENLTKRILQTICAIANNSPGAGGTLLLGVADSESDARRVKKLDNVEARVVADRYVVGIDRERAILDESPEEYFGRIKILIRNSGLSEDLKQSILSSLVYSDYFGLGVIVVKIPAQKQVSTYAGKVYIRSGDDTMEVLDAASVLEVGKRFS